ncbi:uncharacterized protein LOC129056423 [Pongo abelii]|uniref:uncharacterized protein LOC129056423 n=1 Tax=Pongo abelii TaxID=9601 RepID=UPI0023E8766B|nr:uncharacterized protein LOC129056423 [Pongo abelii]
MRRGRPVGGCRAETAERAGGGRRTRARTRPRADPHQAPLLRPPAPRRPPPLHTRAPTPRDPRSPKFGFSNSSNANAEGVREELSAARVDLKVLSPQPRKEKAPGAQSRSRAAGSPPRAAPPGRVGEPAIPHLPRRPAPAPSSPAPTPRRPSAGPALLPTGGGAARSALSPFFPLSPQPRPRRSYPASRLPESPAAAAVSSRLADSSTDLVQELSQDTHSLPGPPPRSRFRRSLAETQELGEAPGETDHHHWPPGRGRGQRKKQFLGCLFPFPSPFRLPGDPH